MHSYVVEYLNENEFKKKEKSLKKYNMIAFKKLIFDHVPALRDGKFDGVVVSRNSTENIVKYELKLPTDHMFSKVHGDIKLHYTVYENQKLIMLDDLTPEILSEGHQKELEAYKEKHKGEKFLINRNKGLGEQDSSELSVCILNENTRRIEQIIVDDFEETNALFETLMGTNVSLRKDWLLKHAEEAND